MIQIILSIIIGAIVYFIIWVYRSEESAEDRAIRHRKLVKELKRIQRSG